MPRVYLAGPLTRTPYDEAADWRKAVSLQLADYAIEGVSPLRGLEYLKGRAQLFTCKTEDAHHVLTSDAGCTARCKADVLSSDAILANFLGAQKASIGTCVELGWADAFHKPVVMVVEEEGNVHDHAILRGVCGYRVSCLLDAVEMIKLLVLADPVRAEENLQTSRAQLAQLDALLTDNKRKLAEEKAQAKSLHDLIRDLPKNPK